MSQAIIIMSITYFIVLNNHIAQESKSTNFRAKCLSKIEKVKKLSGVPTNTVI